MPMMNYVFTGSVEGALATFFSIMPAMFVSFLIFMINYWWLVPYFYHNGKRLAFYSLNLAFYFIIIAFSTVMWFHFTENRTNDLFILFSSIFVTMMFLTGAAALALAIRNSSRNKMLREQFIEEQRRHAEAELVWLKNQINPHFLFNTLNNISALINIDADLAQECISRLSDLLRYAMYETSKPHVDLKKEVEFMKDYISLMKLRCSSRTDVNANFEVTSGGARIAPLLLVSLIENAFKHGVSSKEPSSIDVSLQETDNVMTFTCVNTNHAKDISDKSGSGIGLVNMRRRLDLLYGGNYEWIQKIDDRLFKIIIKIKLDSL